MICGDDGVEPRKASSRVLFDAEVSAEGETCRFCAHGVRGVLGELRAIPSRAWAAMLNQGAILLLLILLRWRGRRAGTDE
jgi:hypothetical protein